MALHPAGLCQLGDAILEIKGDGASLPRNNTQAGVLAGKVFLPSFSVPTIPQPTWHPHVAPGLGAGDSGCPNAWASVHWCIEGWDPFPQPVLFPLLPTPEVLGCPAWPGTAQRSPWKAADGPHHPSGSGSWEGMGEPPAPMGRHPRAGDCGWAWDGGGSAGFPHAR